MPLQDWVSRDYDKVRTIRQDRLAGTNGRDFGRA